MALDVFTPLFFLSILTLWVSLRQWQRSQLAAAGKAAPPPDFLLFRQSFLVVYLLNMMADWIQGPYIYPLYAARIADMQSGTGGDSDSAAIEASVTTLLVTGFVSSALFGTLFGSAADVFGRKRLCQAYCVLYLLSCLSTLSTSYAILFFGRVLGGVSTSLLFSVFESWMVAEHTFRGYSPDWLAETFGLASFGNGIVAIIAGVLAQFSFDAFGVTAPFLIASVILVLGLATVTLLWTENQASAPAATPAPVDAPPASKPAERSLVSQIQQSIQGLGSAVTVILGDPSIFAVGVVQSMFEASMYCFVLVWFPALKEAGGGADIPAGWVFSSFMVSFMLGSSLFGWIMTEPAKMSIERLTRLILLGCALVLAGCALTQDQNLLLLLFNVFEFFCGLYFPTLGTLRSMRVPEQVRSSVINVFRIPLNFTVVLIMMRIHAISTTGVFWICAVMVGISGFFVRGQGTVVTPAAKV